MKESLLTTLIVSASLFCLSPVQAQPSDPSAQTLLEKVAKKYSQMTAFSVDFVYEMKQPAAQMSDQLIGKAFLQGEMYRLELGGQQISSDGKAIWSYSRETNEVTITVPEPESSFMLQNFFNLHKEKYHYQTAKKEKSNHTIALSPQDKSQSLFKIELNIDTKSTSIRSCKLFYKDGSRHIYRIRSLHTEKKQPLHYFRFNRKTHEDAEVIDLR